MNQIQKELQGKYFFNWDTGCVEYPSTIMKKYAKGWKRGYSLISLKVNGKWIRIGTHRAAAILYGIIKEKDDVKNIMHSCDNPRCITYHHLSAGSQKENLRDCMNKGRWNGNQYTRRIGE